MYRQAFRPHPPPHLAKKTTSPMTFLHRPPARSWKPALGHLIEMRGIGLITARAVAAKTCALSQGGDRPCMRPVPCRLRVPLHRQRDGFVQDHRLGDGLGPPERSRASALPSDSKQESPACVPRSLPSHLIVDEAHNLRSEVLRRSLRLPSPTTTMERRESSCLLLVGQAELRRRLGMRRYEALSPANCRPLPRGRLAATQIGPYPGCICCAWPAPSCRSWSRPPSKPCSKQPGPAHAR